MTPNASSLVLCAALLAACASSSRRLDRMYAELASDHAAPIEDEEDHLALARRQEERLAAVRGLVEAGEVQGAERHFEAAMILVGSDDQADLELAERQALEAARLGDDRGFRVAAEAIDKQLVKQGLRQRFGTQYALEPASGRWRLYPLDPATSDAERAAMGVPPLVEIVAGEARLNQARQPPRR